MTSLGPQFHGKKVVVDARRAAVLRAMQARPEHAWSEEDLALAVRHAFTRNEVKQSLRRLIATEKIVVVERGNRSGKQTTYGVKKGRNDG